jgi:hypothetical protein
MKCNAVKKYGGVEVQFRPFLTSALYGGESASGFGQFTSMKRAPDVEWIGDSVNPF